MKDSGLNTVRYNLCDFEQHDDESQSALPPKNFSDSIAQDFGNTNYSGSMLSREC